MIESASVSLAMVSHELKNPLTLIHSSFQMLGGYYPEITKNPLWNQVLFDLNYMSQLLSELSALNSVQSLKYSEINIRHYLTSIFQSFSSEAEKQNKKILLKMERPDLYMEADALKLKEVFVNLIKNAMEATQSGDYIMIKVKERWENVIFDVSDTGSGIDQERLETIFDPFITYNKTEGTGLGLTIVKHFIEAHDGIVQVFSKPSKGTRFVIVIPMHKNRKMKKEVV